MEPRDAERDVLPPVGSMTMDELEKAMIVKSLKHHNGNISKVAQALGLSRAALVPPVREVRDRRVSLRARFVAYLVVVHLLMAGVAWFVVPQNRFYLLAVEAVLALSFLAGLALTRRFFESLEFVRQSAQLLEDSDFMSRVREVKQADVDRLIQVYNRMVDALRGERVQLQEQQHFLSRVLRESPGGIVVLDFEGRVSLANPAAERLLQAPGETAGGHRSWRRSIACWRTTWWRWRQASGACSPCGADAGCARCTGHFSIAASAAASFCSRS